ncbi:MAG: GBS Bsp-like repeat-containing protein, partial [Hespellia sp.]|nr:GBS Bsp-like repeat-containing protein [Hespellia sp.]
IGLTDTGIKLESAALEYRSVTTQEKMTMQASNLVDNTALFEQNYQEGAAEDSYELVALKYVVGGTEQTVEFANEQIEAGYSVTAQPEVAEQSEEAEESGISVYAIDEEGNMVEQSSGDISDAASVVEEVLDEASVAEQSGVDEGVSALSIDDEMSSAKARSVDNTRASNMVVAISAGHDSSHTGAHANGLNEEELTLKVAQACKAELETYAGVSVYMTRSSSECPYPGKTSGQDNASRIEAAKNAGARVYVDIHFNSADSSAANGAEVYYPNKSYSSSINTEGYILANQILNQLEALGLSNRGEKIRDCTTGETDSAGILEDYYTTNNLCKSYGFPGVIVEHAFLTGSSDASKLRNENFVNSLGVADATGIAKTFGLKKAGAEDTTTVPTVQNVQIVKRDDFKGTYRIQISGVSPTSNAKKVLVPVWSSANGQDDIIWYTAQSSSDGVYYVDINRANHKNSVGTYNAHVYITDSKGTQRCANTSTFNVSKSSASVSVAKTDNTEKTFRVTASISNASSEINSAMFAVWSESGGQDDLVWYKGNKDGSGKWIVDIPISNHKSTGKYQVHAYAKMNPDDNMAFMSSTTFNVSPTSATVTVTNYDQNAGTFDVNVKNIVSPTGIQKVQVPVWCASNQSDLVWYEAEKQSDGSYKVNVSTKNHKYAVGTYNIHAYITSGLGIQQFVGKTTQNIKLPEINITAADSDGAQKSFALKASGVGKLGPIKEVNFAVWSTTGGQDDLVWYGSKQDSNGVWNTSAFISNHKTAGSYNVDAYARLQNGADQYIGGTTFEVTDPTATIVVQNYNQDQGSFDVVVKNISSASGVNEILVPVWCAPDQSDLVWYSANNQGDNSYKITVNMKNHKYSIGTYQIHSYINCGNGIFSFVGNTTQGVKLPDVQVSAGDAAGTQSDFQIKASGVGKLGPIKEVNFAVWSTTGGQDDLAWYGSKQDSNGVWNTSASISNHKTAGSYNVDAYVRLQNGADQYIGGTTFEVTVPTATIVIQNYNQDQGSFDVVVKNISSASGVNEILVPVWCAPDQSDLVWYSANNQGDNSYKITVNMKNRNCSVP